MNACFCLSSHHRSLSLSLFVHTNIWNVFRERKTCRFCQKEGVNILVLITKRGQPLFYTEVQKLHAFPSNVYFLFCIFSVSLEPRGIQSDTRDRPVSGHKSSMYSLLLVLVFLFLNIILPRVKEDSAKNFLLESVSSSDSSCSRMKIHDRKFRAHSFPFAPSVFLKILTFSLFLNCQKLFLGIEDS